MNKGARRPVFCILLAPPPNTGPKFWYNTGRRALSYMVAPPPNPRPSPPPTFLPPCPKIPGQGGRTRFARVFFFYYITV